ncbi:hydrolase [Crepidotus variabilis]|uniref:Hydrolase n=1 Tax=Crepidotus variabilis TaxID=179855 RepID=A0A9P6EAI8_9AGAR|nr:hydrolase [Crepidotus variabilis]
MPGPRINLKIGVVQFAPKIGQVQVNIAKGREICRKIEPKSLDLLCFPEMIFSGYVFDNAAAISPYLEHPKTGPTSLFCSKLAKELQCHVIAGYPEILSDDEHGPGLSTSSSALSTENQTEVSKDEETIQPAPVGANSAILYGPSGEWIGGYRKSHLFVTDKTWCKVGSGFKSFPLPPPLNITMSLGICMDLNPRIPEWTLSTGPYEMADYCLEQKANLLVLLNAWLDTGTELDENCDWGTLNYWAARLRPLWAKEGDIGLDSSDEDDDLEQSREKNDSPPCVKSGRARETIVVICNRSGEENGKTFAGSSSIFSMCSGSGRPKLLDTMGRKEEGVRIWNIQVEVDEPSENVGEASSASG